MSKAASVTKVNPKAADRLIGGPPDVCRTAGRRRGSGDATPAAVPGRTANKA